MSDQIHCPNGHLLGLAPGLQGAKVQCPLCQVIFGVPIPATAKLAVSIMAVESVPQFPLAPLAALAPPPQPSSASADRIHCPNGHLIGLAPGLEGKSVMCPLCQVIFDVPLRATPVDCQELAAPAARVAPPASLAPPLSPVVPDGIIPAYSLPPPLPPTETSPGIPADFYLDDRSSAPRARDVDADIAYFRRKKKRAARHTLMRSVDTGLGCYRWKCLICAVVLMLPYIAAWLALALRALQTGHPDDNRVLEIVLTLVFILGAIGFFTVLVLGVVGAIFILRAPPVVDARGLVTANMALEAITSSLYLLMQFLDLAAIVRGSRSGSTMGPFLGISIWLCVIGQTVLLLYFLRKLAVHQKHSATIADLKDLLDMTVGLIIGALGILVLTAILIRPAPIIALIIVVIVALVAWGAFGRLLFRIAALITCIRERL